MKKRTEDFYLASEAELVGKGLTEFGIHYTKDNNAISPKTGMHVIRLEFEVDDAQYAELVRWYANRRIEEIINSIEED